MGNVCQIDNECLQSPVRDQYRGRSLSQNIDNLSLKKLIQLKKMKITQQYDMSGILGEGSFGSVFKVVHRKTKIMRAAKRIEKKRKSIQSLEEFLILKRLDHPNIIRLYDIYVESKYLYIVMDYCEGGELFQRIIKQGNLTQNEARIYMKQLLSGIHHCHSNNIMHRDLKPQNIMFLNKNQKDLKIIDFGVGTSFEASSDNTLKIGSIYYIAPEVIKKKYNQKCDVWSLGIILYILLAGKPPFIAKTDKDIYSLILKGQVPFPEKKWNLISQSAKNLVQRMLVVDPAERITAKQALNHPWIKLQNQSGDQKLLVGSQLTSLSQFCQMNEFQTSIMMYISHNFMQNQTIGDLQSKFKSIDVNGDGKISWHQFYECYIQNMPLAKEVEIKDIFNKLDKNQSGYIDYSEFITSCIDKAYIAHQNLVQKAFYMIDKDKNGYLSKSEMIQAFGGCSDDLYHYIITEFDVNNDGKISKYQFKLAMKGLLKK